MVCAFYPSLQLFTYTFVTAMNSFGAVTIWNMPINWKMKNSKQSWLIFLMCLIRSISDTLDNCLEVTKPDILLLPKVYFTIYNQNMGCTVLFYDIVPLCLLGMNALVLSLWRNPSELVCKYVCVYIRVIEGAFLTLAQIISCQGTYQQELFLFT